MHYKRLQRNGHTGLATNRRTAETTVAAWFMSKVETTETCWLWQGAVNASRRGYGVFYDADRGRKISAHHFLVPPAPDGHEYHHRCSEVTCVRPDHLELLTVSEHRHRHKAGRKIPLTGEHRMRQ